MTNYVFWGDVFILGECSNSQVGLEDGNYRIVDGKLYRITNELPISLIEKSENLNPEFSAAVDRHFEDLA